MTTGALVEIPVAAEAAATALDAHDDFRVLRRMREMRRDGAGGIRDGLLAGVALDVETTGLGPDDVIIELALVRFWADPEGHVVLTGRPHTWLEDPGRPLSADVVRLTGLDDAMLAGRSILDAEAASLIRDADVVFAHNASFDRPHVERRLPFCAGRPWICSLRDVDWRGLGFEGGRLGDLLLQAGWFYSAHRAATDVMALLHLLDHPLDGGGTVLRNAVERASRPTFRVAAAGAPFEAKDLLKGRGYRWDAAARAWWREVDADALDVEAAWNRDVVYAGRRDPDVQRVTWTTRHSGG